MNFREALEHEIASQGLSISEITRISGVSKGTIYNILKGITKDARIRPLTRRAIARGCNRKLKNLGGGEVQFVDEGMNGFVNNSSDVRLRFLPNRPFLSHQFFKEPFDWLHGLEEAGSVTGFQTVDRVFQKREEFLGLVIDNGSKRCLLEVWFDLKISFGSDGPSRKFSCRIQHQVEGGSALEKTVFLLAGPRYEVEILNPYFIDFKGRRNVIGDPLFYDFKGCLK